jgi:hypothetical protein
MVVERLKLTARRRRSERMVVIALLVLPPLLGRYLATFDPPSPHIKAYIDPGSGALLVQVVVSLVTGLLLSLKRVRETVRRALRRPGPE